MKKTFLILFTLVLLLLPLSFAQPFVSESGSTENSFDVSILSEFTSKVLEPINIRTTVFNSTGTMIDITNGIGCVIEVYNKTTQSVLIHSEMDTQNEGFNFTQKFLERGKYNYLIYCNTSTQGGFRTGQLEITESGDPEKQDNINYLAMLTLFLVIIIYLYITFYFTSDRMADHGLIKVGLLTASLWFMLLPVRFAYISLLYKGATTGMLNIFDILYTVMIYINVSFTFYMIIFFIISFARRMLEYAEQKK